MTITPICCKSSTTIELGSTVTVFHHIDFVISVRSCHFVYHGMSSIGNEINVEIGSLFFLFFTAGSLRLGGEKCTYDDHVIVIGDAAGMIDPMTG